jgi:retinol-binding protein 3
MRKRITKKLIVALAALLALLIAAKYLTQGPNRPCQTDIRIDATTRAKVIEALIKELNGKYIFPDVASQLEKSLRERVGRKEYDSIISAATFSKTLSEHLQEINHDKHLGVHYINRELPPGPDCGETPGMSLPSTTNFGFEKVERLRGNTGYLKFNVFMEPETGAGDTAAAAMNSLSDTDALIIDLRQNFGGSPAMVALLCTYFFAGPPIHLNDILWRTSDGISVYESWTRPNVAGKRYVDKEVYVLTSKNTFSAAEEFAYNLKTQKRALIVGETTAGAANPGDMVQLDDHFKAFIPTGRAVNPITKTNWEGAGVAPDVDVPAEQALYTAQVAA